MCFQPGDRVKQVRVEINPLRYLAIYGTVREYTDPDILVQWDDGTELRHDANAISTSTHSEGAEPAMAVFNS